MPKLIINKDKLKDLENLKEIIAERDNLRGIVKELEVMGIIKVDSETEIKDPELEQENKQDDENAYESDKENFTDDKETDEKADE